MEAEKQRTKSRFATTNGARSIRVAEEDDEGRAAWALLLCEDGGAVSGLPPGCWDGAAPFIVSPSLLLDSSNDEDSSP